MKDAGEVHLAQVLGTKNAEIVMNVVPMVDQIWDRFACLRGTMKGQMIDLSRPDDEPPWPHMNAYNAMNGVDKKKVYSRYRPIARVFVQEFKRRCSDKWRWKYDVNVSYAGNGRIVFWWSEKRARKKKDNPDVSIP